MYANYLKRILDFICSIIGLIILSPLFIIISVWIKIDSEGPVFFKQKRVGKNKKQFNILKFRTMDIKTPKDMPTHKLVNPDCYITKSGKFLRKTSLDELPQLINIINGDMSIIGPRPALWNQEDLIETRDIHSINYIRPGLTGWAQINGRDELEINEKVKFDCEYKQNMSFLFDVKCLLGTVIAVLKHNGIVEGKAVVIQNKDDKNEENINHRI